MKKIIFLLQCPDRKGLLANISAFFYDAGFNILHCQQHTDTLRGRYFMRIELDMAGLSSSRQELERRFGEFIGQYEAEWSIRYSDRVPKIAIMVSREGHCLYDLLLRRQEGEIRAEIPLIISNHPDLEFVAGQFQIPFHCLPVDAERRRSQEAAVLDLLVRHHIELVVLARYMRILSGEFLNEWQGGVINIHHAFLPAFQGAGPYQRAYERGVKMIGATAHYATADLDQGPIIEQDVERVNHEHAPEDLKAIGRDIERVVLARAVRAHLEHRVIVTENRTVVF